MIYDIRATALLIRVALKTNKKTFSVFILPTPTLKSFFFSHFLFKSNKKSTHIWIVYEINFWIHFFICPLLSANSVKILTIKAITSYYYNNFCMIWHTVFIWFAAAAPLVLYYSAAINAKFAEFLCRFFYYCFKPDSPNLAVIR